MKLLVDFNDLLALITLVAVIPLLWVGVGRGWLDLPGEVTGATILSWGLIFQYYFRKKKGNLK